MGRRINSLVFAPPAVHGGVKSLYSVCEWLETLGRSMIYPFDGTDLANWFAHNCRLYDYSYFPDVIIYPEVFQPTVDVDTYRICFALGQRGVIAPNTDLAVCRSPEVLNWVKREHPNLPAVLIRPSINRSVFEHDGRPKKDVICYMTRPNKHPETATLLRQEYGSKVKEIVDSTEDMVAEILKDSKVFVWRGDEKEGSPRPPKEALVAGCVVVGLESDLNEKYYTGFGLRYSTIDEVVRMAGEALRLPLPSDEERLVIRDSKDERQDWLALFDSLSIGARRV